MKYYLSYGSNLNLKKMQERCPDGTVFGTGTLHGYRLLYKGEERGYYLTIEKAEGYAVPVGVWCISDEDESRLDEYEGYPEFYYKKALLLDVKTKAGMKTLECFVYIMYEDLAFGDPTKEYIKECLEGYRDFGFDEGILGKALEDSRDERLHHSMLDNRH